MSADASEATVSPRNLLIVDDEHGQLQTLRDIFTAEGFEVCACATFEEAINRCRDSSFAVAIVDLFLGGDNGIQLLDRIRRAQPSTRTIIHTAYGSFESAKDAVNLGVFAYVEKHGGPADLIRQVHRAAEDFLSEALSQSERRYRDLLNDVVAIVWECDSPSWRFTFVSQQAESILGYPVADWLTKPDFWVDHIHQDDRERCVNLCVDCTERGEDHEFDYRAVAANGQIVWLHDVVHVVKDGDGLPCKLRGVMFDITDKKLAEQALKESEGKFRALIENNYDVVTMFSAEGKCLYASPSITRVLGYEPHELIGLVGPAIVHPEDVAEAKGFFAELLGKPGAIGQFEHRLKHKAGGYRTVEVTGMNLLSEPGIHAMVSIFRDITTRLEAEESVRDSERSLALAQRIAHLGNWELDLASGQLTGSAEMLRMLGLPETEPLPSMDTFVSEFIHPEDVETIARLHQRASTSGATEALEFRFRPRPDHVARFARVEAEAIKGQDGSPQKIIGTFQDITEQKQAESALRNSEEKFRLLTEKSPAIVLIARQTRLVYGNPMLSAVTGYSSDELLRMDLTDVVHPDYRELVVDRHRRRLNGEAVPQQYEIKIVTKHGEDRWLELSAQVIDFEGEPAVLLTCVDLTARKLAEDALRQSEELLRQVIASLEQRVVERTADLEEMNAELAAFAHSVSHDLRAPLRAIEGFAVALAEDYGPRIDEPGRQFIQHIVDSARRMDRLVDDLLSYSRLGRSEIRANSIGLNAVTKEALSQLGSEIRASNAKVDIAESKATVLGHRATLLQVVTNLLTNAIKFVADDVRPEVRMWSERRDDGMIRLWCEDNGIGIDSECQDRIFGVFERLHGIESYPGTGIGLAIVARACERLGGRCGFESQPGQGSRFWVEFPEGDQ